MSYKLPLIIGGAGMVGVASISAGIGIPAYRKSLNDRNNVIWEGVWVLNKEKTCSIFKEEQDKKRNLYIEKREYFCETEWSKSVGNNLEEDKLWMRSKQDYSPNNPEEWIGITATDYIAGILKSNKFSEDQVKGDLERQQYLRDNCKTKKDWWYSLVEIECKLISSK